MEPFRFHLFVCTQQKSEGVTSCPASGSFAVLETLDHEIQSRGLTNDVQLTTCGCMGLCDEGPVMVTYPKGVWYRRVQPSDVSEIVDQHLKHGRTLERLEWDDASAMKKMSIEHGEHYHAMLAARDKAGMLPDHLDQMIRGYQPSRCLLTALELDIFTAIGNGATAEQTGKKINANARALNILLNALVSLGLLSKDAETYKNTPESARYFVQGSKDNHRNGLLHVANLWQRWSTLTDAVRRGTSVRSERDQDAHWTEHFIAAMQRNAQERVPAIVKAIGSKGLKRILDLGGGSGAYSIAFAKANPEARCEILDSPDVVPLTAEYVKQAGIASQVSIRAGDMLTESFGSGYDLIMLNAICHMFSEEQNRQLFRKAHQALVPNGRLALQDFILNDQKTGPQHAALFSLNMLVSTESGADYSEPEYTTWMKDAGFSGVERINLPGPSDLIVGSA